jgi:hypothetical protein
MESQNAEDRALAPPPPPAPPTSQPPPANVAQPSPDDDLPKWGRLYNSDTADGSPWARKVVLSLGMVMLRSM